MESVLTKSRTLIVVSVAIAIVVFLTGALLAPVSLAAATMQTQPQQQELQAVPSYVNPITGAIEDSGQNPDLGQGMSENLIMRTPATKLVDSEGSIFITFRVGLVAESQDLAVELLDEQGSPARSIPYSIIEDFPEDNTRDIRIMVPDPDPMLRISLISIPMGREVICFTTFAPAGEAVEVPTAELPDEVDDTAIVIQEAGDDVIGIAEENRGQVITFLAIVGGVLGVIALVAVLVAVRKKKPTETGTPKHNSQPPESPSDT